MDSSKNGSLTSPFKRFNRLRVNKVLENINTCNNNNKSNKNNQMNLNEYYNNIFVKNNLNKPALIYVINFIISHARKTSLRSTQYA